MASTDKLEAGARIDPRCSAGDNDAEQGKEEEEEEYSSGVVERLRSLVYGESSNINEIRKLIVKKLPASACGVDDAIAPIRANLWSAMLLGLRPEDLNRCAFTADRGIIAHAVQQQYIRRMYQRQFLGRYVDGDTDQYFLHLFLLVKSD